VRVPTVADEAARQVSRERTALTQEQTGLINQMRGWLATWGTRHVVWLALVGSAGGLAAGALYLVVDGRKLLFGPWLATVAAIALVVLLIAWTLARSAAASPRNSLRLLTQPQAKTPSDGEPRSIGPAP